MRSVLGTVLFIMTIIAVKAKVALIAVGNSGKGKSFLLNIILRDNIFVHKAVPDSVTDKVEEVETTMMIHGESTKVGITNIPGLMEVDEVNFKRNKESLKYAIEYSDNQVFMFLIHNSNGRPSPEDVHAFVQFQESYKVDLKSVLFVFNQKPASFSEHDEQRFLALVAHGINAPAESLNFVFIDELPKANFRSPLVTEAREGLLAAIQDCIPAKHQEVKPLMFNQDKIKALKDGMDILEKNNVQLQDALNRANAALASAKGKKKNWLKRIGGFLSGAVELVLGPVTGKFEF